MCARKMSAIRLFLRILDGTHGAGCGREPIVKLLGALIAGGQSRRFSSDKALTVIEGKPLLNHVIDALQPQVDTLVMCGRKWPELACLADRTEPDHGPLGGRSEEPTSELQSPKRTSYAVFCMNK